MVKRKILVRKYSRVRKGKKEVVRKHDRSINSRPRPKVNKNQNKKIDKLIKSRNKKLISRESDIQKWIQKFRTNVWREEEEKRLKDFESIEDDIKGFSDDIEIKGGYNVIGIDGKVTEYIEEAPDVDREKIEKEIQRMVSLYSKKIRGLLNEAKNDLDEFDLSNRSGKQCLSIISDKSDSYWTYLGYLRTSYSSIYDRISLFDYSPTVKFIMQNIRMTLYDIDEQKYYRDKIFGYKKTLKLLDTGV